MAPRPARRMLGLACCVLLASVCHGVAPSTASAPIAAGISKAHHSHSPFSSPTGYFIQVGGARSQAARAPQGMLAWACTGWVSWAAALPRG